MGIGPKAWLVPLGVFLLEVFLNSVAELVSWFIQTFPHFYSEMNKSDHNSKGIDEYGVNPYHIEGSVWTHTMMVLKEMEKVFRFNESTYYIWLIGLLHDLGKPFVRHYNSEKNKVYFTNHEPWSAFLALEVLEKFPIKLSKEQKRIVFETICLHTEPFKKTPEELSDIFTNNIDLSTKVMDFSYCDSNGRFTNVPKVVKFFEPKTRTIEPKEKFVTFLIGLPGAGKSSLIDYGKLENTTPGGIKYVSRDHFIETFDESKSYDENWKKVNQQKIDQLFDRTFERYLETGDSFYIDKTNLAQKPRQKLLDKIPETFEKRAIVIVPTLETIRRRLLKRSKEYGKSIPEEAVQKMIASFYPAMYNEFDRIDYYFEGDL